MFGLPRLSILFILWSATLLLTACGGLAVPQEPARPSPTSPVWRDQEISDHLHYFNEVVVEGRATGTQGFARAATYVSTRLDEYGLQPVLGSEFSVLYNTPLNHVAGGRLQTTGPDTLAFLPGTDFVVDGRSAAGEVRFDRIYLSDTPDTGRTYPGQAVVLLREVEATTTVLEALRDAGVRAVLIAGEALPASSARRIDSLLVVRISLEAAERIVGDSDLLSFEAAGGAPIILPRGIILRTDTDYLPRAAAINTMGFVAGKDPVRSSELVIVCADLDVAGPFMGARKTRAEDLGVGTAALLELARNYAYYARLISIPERTILFAVWSGSRMDHAGLKAYLRSPFWALDQTAMVLYVGLSEEKAGEVREILEPFGIPLETVAWPADTLLTRSIVTSSTRSAQRRRVEPANEPVPDLSLILQRAIPATRQLGQDAHEVLLRSVVSAGPFRPFVSDSVFVPREDTP